MAKRVDPAAVWSVYEEGHGELRRWLTELPEDGWRLDSVLPGWSVADLVAHIATVADSVTALTAAPRGARALPLGDYVAAYAPIAGTVADNARRLAAEAGYEPEAILAAVDDSFVAAARHIGDVGLRDQVVQARRGPVRLGDYLLTRVIEIGVHADDLGRSAPGLVPPTLPRRVERTVTQALLRILAERAPGGSVEVRVPPHAAIQCGDGPRHTRGTPPNVVETDARTWIRLATGRTGWSDGLAAGSVVASGDRADLSRHLPLL